MESGSYRLIDTDSLSWEKHVIGNGIRKVLHVDPPRAAPMFTCATTRPGGLRFAIGGFTIALPERPSSGCLAICRTWSSRRPKIGRADPSFIETGCSWTAPPLSLHGRRTNQESETGSVFLIWSSHGGEFEGNYIHALTFSQIVPIS